MKVIVCPGSINPDFVIRSDRPLRLKNRSMTFHGCSSVYAGGKGRNQAVASRRAGADTTLIGCVGNDFLGKDSIMSLKKEKIKCLIKRRGETGKCVLSIFKGNYQIVGLDLAANKNLKSEDILRYENEIKNNDILLCQIENTKETTALSLKLAKKHKLLTILNPSLVPEDLDFVFKKIIPHSDIVVLNVQEAEQLTKTKVSKANMKSIAEKLKAGIVVITLAEKGCYINFRGKQTYVNAFKVQEKDTTACGDIFIGALAASVNIGSFADFIDSVKYASAAAAISVTRIGASESAPTHKEITDFIQKIQKFS